MCNWIAISECPIPKEGEAPQRVLLGGTNTVGGFAWGEGCIRWDGSKQQMFPRIPVVTHFCVVTPPEGMHQEAARQ